MRIAPPAVNHRSVAASSGLISYFLLTILKVSIRSLLILHSSNQCKPNIFSLSYLNSIGVVFFNSTGTNLQLSENTCASHGVCILKLMTLHSIFHW